MSLLQRRDLFKLAPAAAFAANAIPALAYQMPDEQTPDLPDWWKKRLTEDSTSDPLMNAVVDLINLNRHLRQTLPDGARLVGLQYRNDAHDKINQETVWATARRGGELLYLRPGVRHDWFPGLGVRLEGAV
ncbi:hypothetical protein ATO9_04095 [Pseudooceanicola atlanticus]|uniref:Uncharacterized protein n=2 Tax=Pseudooceanicola atlanticus TaxID=1461694 RepID=A0A0A0EK31_9RHOB|nr:hypothetical protein ATO9_04095 [Pseudooceanicola atlanticus]